MRVGRRNAFTGGVYFAPDLFVVEHGDIRFPLLGASADLGYQRGLFRISLDYKKTFTEVIYSHEPILTSVGLSLSFFAPKYAETRRSRSP